MLNLKHLLTIISFIFCLAFSTEGLGQDWYEIEVLIFEQNSNPYENPEDRERWPSDLDLAWPMPLVELDLTPEASDSEVNQEDIIPKPYAELPAAERRLSNANYAMRVRDQYNLLWHKSWKAPLLPENDSPWVLIQAGEQIGEHYRLEGGLKVHLARYLHLHADLWLTELQPIGAEEQTEFHWSQLPRPELSRWPCIFVKENWPDSARELPDEYFEKPAPEDWYYPFKCESKAHESIDSGELTDLPLPLPAELEATSLAIIAGSNETTLQDAQRPFNGYSEEEGLTSQENLNRGSDDNSASRPFFLNRETEKNAEDSPLDSLPNLQNIAEDELAQEDQETFGYGYPVKEIIHVESRRRMRSEELHYIDHPKIGIIAIIHPVEQPVLEAKPIEYISAPLPRAQP